jgi:hypothetical protein
MPAANPNVERIVNDPEPDLERSLSGFTVRMFYTPSLEEREQAIIEVHAGPVLLETLSVSADKAHDAFRHTALYSGALAEALR